MKIEFPAEMIGQKTDMKKMMTLVAVAVVSVAMIVYTGTSELDHTMFSYMLLCCLGYIGLLVVGIAAFGSKKYFTYAPTGCRLVRKTIEFNASDYDRVEQLLAQGDLPNVRALRRGEGVRMKLEIAYTKDRAFAAYQIFQYLSYEYVPTTEVCYVDSPRVASFCI